MKGLGIALVGLLAVAGGIAAATIITKKKLERENEEDYYDEWDEADWLDDEDFDFDDIDENIADTAEQAAADIKEVNKQGEELIEEDAAPSDETEAL